MFNFPLELSVSFSSAEYSVYENAGTVSVCLELSDDQLTREAAITVELAAVSDTAIGKITCHLVSMAIHGLVLVL